MGQNDLHKRQPDDKGALKLATLDFRKNVMSSTPTQLKKRKKYFMNHL